MPSMFVIISEGLLSNYSMPYIHFINTLNSCGDPISMLSVPNSKYFYVLYGSFLDILNFEELKCAIYVVFCLPSVSIFGLYSSFDLNILFKSNPNYP